MAARSTSNGARPGRAVLLLIAAMAAVAATVWLVDVRWAGPSIGAAAVFAVAFAATDATLVNFEVRRQTWSFGLSEVPLLIGLFTTTPTTVLVSWTLAHAVMGIRQRTRPEKAAFNVVMYAVQVGVAARILHAFPAVDIVRPLSWLAGLSAILATNAIGVICVVCVLTVTGARLSRSAIVTMSVQNLVLGTFLTTFGLLSVYLYRSNPIMLVLWALIALVIVLGYRVYASVIGQRKALEQANEFGRGLEASRAAGAPVSDLIEPIRELLNARRAILGLCPPDGLDGLAATITVGDEQTSAVDVVPDAISSAALAGRRALLITTRSRAPDTQAALASRGAHEVVSTPLRSGTDTLGYLEVIDRQGARQRLSQHDQRLLELLGSKLAAEVENQRLVDRLRHEARFDQLTDLPNRAQFVETVEAVVAERPPESDGIVGVVLFGLDALKDVTVSLGRDAGDQVVLAIADRVRAELSADHPVARVGPDVFGVVVPAPDADALLSVARRMHATLHGPCEVSGITIEMGLSAGVAAWPEHATDVATLLQHADVAIDAARESDQPVILYTRSMDSGSLHRLQLVTDLRLALESGQISVAYQPKIALTTQELVGVETLVRWQHPHHGTISPDEFVPLAERTGLIGPLTTHVLTTSLRQCRAWLDGGRQIGIAVNLSVRSLLNLAFADQVAELLAETGVPPELLTFEITESVVMSDPDKALPVLHALHNLGVELSVDDFGTGYSALAYLRRLPIDEVKIDKSFVLGMDSDLGDHAIVKAIIELCHSLVLRVVAEGVEAEVVRDTLATMECDLIQGYLISRPLPIDRLESWLVTRTSAATATDRGRRLRLVP